MNNQMNNEMNNQMNNQMNNKNKIIKPSTISLVALIFIAVAFCIYKFGIEGKFSSTNSVNKTVNSEVYKNETMVQQDMADDRYDSDSKLSTLSMAIEEFPKVDGATAMLPMVKEIVKTVVGLNEQDADKYIEDNTQGKSAKVYASLINKEKDLIFVSEPSDDILRQAKEKDVEFDMTGIGYDGFVFLLNENNPVKSLTIEQIQKIYTGEITNWKEVGGDDAKIVAYQREANSGSQNLMEKMVMKDKKMKKPDSDGLIIGAMTGLVDAVSTGENSKYSIGYSIYLYAKEQYTKDNVKFLNINGIEANDANIKNKSYPLTKVVYAITRKDVPADSNVRTLIKWLLTPQGQKVVAAGGYVV